MVESLHKVPLLRNPTDYSEQLEDERLLGRQSTRHASTTSIVKPQTGWERTEMSRLHHSGGPKPTNTLGRPNNQASDRNRRHVAKITSSTVGRLKLESVSGDTLGTSSTSKYWDNEGMDERAHKRRKRDHGVVELASPSSADVAGEVSSKNTHVKGPNSQVFKNVTINPKDGIPTLRHQYYPDLVRSSGQDENRRLQGLMDSGRRTRAKKKWGRRNSSEKTESRNSGKSSPISAHISIEDSDDELQLLRSGQTKKSQTAVLPNLAGDHGANHHPKFVGATKLSDLKASLLPRHHDLYRPDSSRLRDTFIGTNGQRRGEDRGRSSPDELAGENTVGRQKLLRSTSPQKQGHQQSIRKLDTTNAVKERSATRSSAAKSRKDAQRPAVSEPWYVEVDLINRPVVLGHAEGAPWRLTFDADKEQYTFKHEDNDMRESAQKAKIARQSINSIQYTEGGSKMRVLQSRPEGVRDSIVEFGLSHQEDVEKILTHLQMPRPLQCVGKPEFWMEKVFAVSQAELDKRPLPSTQKDPSTDVLPSRHQASDMDKDSWERAMKTVDTGERTKTKIVHDLMKRTRGDEHGERQTASEAAATSTKTSKAKTTEHSSISNLLEHLKPARPLPNSRRSTRLSGLSALDYSNFLDQEFDAEPPKFSKTQPGLGPRWKRPLTYPPEGKKKATVDFVDLEKLDEGEFLNDALVTFKMRQLEHELEEKNPNLARRVYFFNTFFYGRLTDGVPAKDINYSAVQKWTKNVDIFSYDYVVVPINEMAHWYLAIICNLPGLERAMSFGEERSPSSKSKADDDLPIPTSQESDSLNRAEAGNTLPSPTEANVSGSFAEISLEDCDAPRTGTHRLWIGKRQGHGQDADNEGNDTSDPSNIAALSDREPSQQLARTVKTEESMLSATEVESPSKQTKPPKQTKKGKRKSIPPIMHYDHLAPIIIILDSLAGNHPSVTRRLKDYLVQEAVTKRGGMTIDTSTIKGLNAKYIPTQSNFSDCGLYMLGYIERFLNDGPDFVRKTIKQEHKGTWTINASHMRTELRKLIFSLHDAQETKSRGAKALKKKEDEKREKPSKLDDPNVDAEHIKSGSGNDSTPTQASPRSEARDEGQNSDDAVSNEAQDKTVPEKASHITAELAVASETTSSDMHASDSNAQDIIRSQDDDSVMVIESQSGPVHRVLHTDAHESPPDDVAERVLQTTQEGPVRELPAEIGDSQENKPGFSSKPASPSEISPPAKTDLASYSAPINDSFEITDSAPAQKKRTRTTTERKNEEKQPPPLPPRKIARVVRDTSTHSTRNGTDRQPKSSKMEFRKNPAASPVTYGRKRTGQSDGQDGDLRHYMRSPPAGALPTSEKFKQKRKTSTGGAKVEMQFEEDKEKPTTSVVVVDLDD